MVVLLIGGGWTGCSRPGADQPTSNSGETARVYSVRGVVKSVRPEEGKAVIQHEAIPGYMDAMTMPFRVRDAAELRKISAGDTVEFRFHVASEESWMDQITVRASAVPEKKSGLETGPGSAAGANPTSAVEAGRSTTRRPHPLMDFKFTNQLGQPVSLSDFKGRALAITFIFTRCPVPEYCPRLTRNFHETSEKLSRLAGSPTNWHLISFTIDPAFDTPRVLKGYAERYQYDPAKWSFLTGPAEQITDIVRESGVTIEPGEGLFSHNFRTLIIGTNGQLQTSIPIGGPISDAIVEELLRAMAPTNAPAPGPLIPARP